MDTQSKRSSEIETRARDPMHKGKLLPLRFLRPGMVMPVLSGPLRGSKWIVGSSPHRCWLGTHEREVQALFAKTVSEKSTVFDIGGQVGFYSLLASRRAGREGNVFVFEPLAQNLNYLRVHLGLNRVRNVTVIEAAVSYKNGFALLEACPDGQRALLSSSGPLLARPSSSGPLLARPSSSGPLRARPSSSGPLRVRTCSLDGLLDLGQVPVPDVIKIDIGGGEFAALCGAKSLLSRAGPAIFLTTHGESLQRKCSAFLEMLGYRLEPIDGKPPEAPSEAARDWVARRF